MFDRLNVCPSYQSNSMCIAWLHCCTIKLQFQLLRKLWVTVQAKNCARNIPASTILTQLQILHWIHNACTANYKLCGKAKGIEYSKVSNESVNQSVGQSVSQSVSQSVDQSVSWSVKSSIYYSWFCLAHSIYQIFCLIWWEFLQVYEIVNALLATKSSY